MEHILGQPIRFLHCTKFTVLTDELACLDLDIRILVISCMTEILATLFKSSEPQLATERAMEMINSSLFALCHQRGGAIRIFIAPCTYRSTPFFSGYCKLSMVRFSMIHFNI